MGLHLNGLCDKLVYLSSAGAIGFAGAGDYGLSGLSCPQPLCGCSWFGRGGLEADTQTSVARFAIWLQAPATYTLPSMFQTCCQTSVVRPAMARCRHLTQNGICKCSMRGCNEKGTHGRGPLDECVCRSAAGISKPCVEPHLRCTRGGFLQGQEESEELLQV